MHHNLDYRKRQIMKYIHSNPGVDIQEIAKAIGITKEAISYHLKRLIDMNQIITSLKPSKANSGRPKICYRATTYLREVRLLELYKNSDTEDNPSYNRNILYIYQHISFNPNATLSEISRQGDVFDEEETKKILNEMMLKYSEIKENSGLYSINFGE